MPFQSSSALVESLESRTLLGAHPIIFGGVQPSAVTAKIVGSDVEIRGDALANTIVITPVGTSGTKIKIAGLSGTTVNGNASATLSGVNWRLTLGRRPGYSTSTACKPKARSARSVSLVAS